LLIFLSKQQVPVFGSLYFKNLLSKNVPPVNGEIEVFEKNARDCLEENFSTKEILVESESPEKEKKLSYVVSLKSRQFEPTENSNEALKCFNFLSRENRYYAFIQLYDTPSNQDKTSLGLKGIKLLNYIPENAWFASFSKHLIDKEIQELNEIIRWAGIIQSEDKVYQDIWQDKFGSWAVEEDFVLITISFFEGVDNKKIKEVLQEYKGEVLSKIEVSNKHTIKISRDFIKKIAEENVVRYIDQIPPPPTIQTTE